MPRLALLAIALLTAVALSVSLYFSHAAGCAADLKTGSTGDLQQALALQGQGLGFMLLFLLGSASLGFAYGRSAIGVRIARAIAIVVVAYALELYLGIQLEVAGVQDCWFAH